MLHRQTSASSTPPANGDDRQKMSSTSIVTAMSAGGVPDHRTPAMVLVSGFVRLVGDGLVEIESDETSACIVQQTGDKVNGSTLGICASLCGKRRAAAAALERWDRMRLQHVFSRQSVRALAACGCADRADTGCCVSKHKEHGRATGRALRRPPVETQPRSWRSNGRRWKSCCAAEELAEFRLLLEGMLRYKAHTLRTAWRSCWPCGAK